MKRKWKHMLSLILTVCIIITSCIWNGQSTSAEEAKPEYCQGWIRMQIQENGGGILEIPALYREDMEQIWVNGADFAQYFDHYYYSYDAESKSVRLNVYSKEIGFVTGSSESAYRMGDTECFYRLKAPVVSYDEKVWIPVESFFMYLGCSVDIVSGDGKTEDWDGTEDYITVGQPCYTVMDILYDLCQRGKGLEYLFDYEHDLGLTEEEIEKTGIASDGALKLYGLVTAEMTTWLKIASEMIEQDIIIPMRPETALLNVMLELWPGEISLSEGIEYYENMELFLEMMLKPGIDQMEVRSLELEENSKDLFNIISSSGVLGKAAEQWENPFRIELFHMLENDTTWPMFTKIFDSAIEGSDRFLETVQKTEAATGELIGAIYTCYMAVKESENFDMQMLEAMRCYLDESRYKSELDNSLRNALQYQVEKADLSWGVAESTENLIQEFLGNRLTDAAGNALGAGNMAVLVPAFAKLGWSLIESTGLSEVTGKIEEPKCFQMSVYGIMCEWDAWNTLCDEYWNVAMANELSQWGHEGLGDSAMLALNYLKACYVTMEAALTAFAGTENESTPVYQEVAVKKMETAALIHDLQKAIDAGLLGYGVPFCRSVDENELTFEMFVSPELREDGKQYTYYEEPLNEWTLNLVPLYYEGLTKEEVRIILTEQGFREVIVTDGEPDMYCVTTVESEAIGYDISVHSKTGVMTVSIGESWQTEFANLLQMKYDPQTYKIEKVSLDAIEPVLEEMGYTNVQVNEWDIKPNIAIVTTYAGTWLSYTLNVDMLTGIANVTFMGGSESWGHVDVRAKTVLSGNPLPAEPETDAAIYSEALTREYVEARMREVMGEGIFSEYTFSSETEDSFVYMSTTNLGWSITVDRHTGVAKTANYRGVIMGENQL